MIAIVMFTHAFPKEREAYAFSTLDALSKLQVSEDIWFHLADDGSPQNFRDGMMQELRDIYGDHTSVTNSEGNGYGASYNLATQIVHAHADIILPLEDDWQVTREFDLDPFVKVLRDGAFNCIRMGYIGYTSDLLAKFEYHDEKHYLRLSPSSPEKHVFAGGPRLETRDFEKSIGVWPTKISAGQTELEVAGKKAAREGVAWPIDAIHPRGDLFVHIGSNKAGTGEKGSISSMQTVSS